jgi:hypothetical protein
MARRTLSPIRPLPAGHLMDQVAASLRCLGETRGEVHWTLMCSGIRGEPRATTYANPVVRYLNRRLDIAARLEIPLHSEELHIDMRDDHHTMLLPRAVVEFLDHFHRALYPALES